MHHSAQEQWHEKAGGEDANLAPVLSLPNWLPDAVRLYLNHTEDGHSLRALARRDGLNASTVLRHVRRCEMRRDDPLVDEALAAFHRGAPQERTNAMQHTIITSQTVDDTTIAAEAPRLLRRLAEAGAFLAIAPNMEKAAVMRAMPDGRLMRMAVVDRAVAQAFALKEWIAQRGAGKVTTYELTASGRAELKARLAHLARGMAEAPSGFGAQSENWNDPETGGTEAAARRVRYNLAESPVAVLGRRRDKDGKPYLEPEFIRAAERFREDFELAQMGATVTQNWEGFLTGRTGASRGEGMAAPRDARARVAAALADLGPDLGHIALRVCCYLEGVEEAEQRMGWAARSGKVVLRIALRRLARHFDEVYGPSGPLIG
jgi:DNA-binding PadR family transcriptional regulator